MIAKAFEGLNPWFETLLPRIKPYYRHGLSAGDEPEKTKYRLCGFVRQVNTIKLLLLDFVNEEIKRREAGTCLSAGDETTSVEAVPIPDDVGLEIVEDILDIKISDAPLPAVDDDPAFEFGLDAFE